VYQCPFGAMMEKSYILNVIDLIKKSESNTRYKVYAVRGGPIKQYNKVFGKAA
jgi:hypothetical protein